MKKLFSIFMIFVLLACTDLSKKSKEPTNPSKPKEILKTMVEYTENDQIFNGYMVYEDSIEAKKTGIILIHHWVGLDEFTMKEADKFAREGYVVFAMDMYGKDVKVTNHEEAGKISGYYKKNREVMRGRVARAIEELKKNPNVDPNKIGGVGYCFGGDALIDYMLSTDEFKAGVSFHGFYTSPLLQNKLNGVLQINHGVLDKSSTMDQLKAFMDIHPEVEVYLYDDAGHAYTVTDGPNYDEKAAKESFERAKLFLKTELN